MEGHCTKCGKHKHQEGQKCSAHGQKCKACGRIGHFAKVCMTTRRQRGGHKSVNTIQVSGNSEDQYIDELGHTANAQPMVQMIKLINKVNTTQTTVSTGKHLKFKVASHPRKPFNNHLIVRVDTGADVSCMS